MRISTGQMHQFGVDSILKQQETLSKTQLQLASGKKIRVPSDDPVGTTQLLQLRQTHDSTKQFQENSTAVVNRLSLEEGVLDNVTSLLQRARELAIEGVNATQSNETRSFISAEIRELLGELLGMANVKDGAGDYLFAGGKGANKPFVVNPSGGFTYYGDQTQRELQVAPGRFVADGDAGSAVFEQVRNGNGTFVTEATTTNTGTGVIGPGTVLGSFVPAITGANVNGYTLQFITPTTWEVVNTGDGTPVVPGPMPYSPGAPIQFNGAEVIVEGIPAAGDTFTIKSSENQSIFTTLDNLATALESPINSAAQRAVLDNAMNRALTDIDQGVQSVLTVRASVGARLNAVEGQQGVNEDFMLQTKMMLSGIEDLDYADAVSRLNVQMAGLSAAQQTYMKVQGLSMFNYL